MTPPRLSLERIRSASTVIDPVFLNSPLFESEPLGFELGVQVLLKVETLNPIRSFKGRGAELYVAREAGETPLVCASAGNFGQAMAYAARARALPLTVFAAENANPLKVERMRALGARVHLAGADFDAAKEAARAFADANGARFVEDGREVAISEGAGTIALELCAAERSLDALFVPLGNGALLAGVATVLRALQPSARIVAVAAAGAPAMLQSLERGAVVVGERADTIADGIAVRVPVPEAVADLHGLVDELLLVDDAAIVAAMRRVHRQVGVVVEPAGVVGLAGIAARAEAYQGARVATILCGSNITEAQARAWLG
jgi:threonine dehydratase